MANLGYIQISRVCNQECIFCSNPSTGKLIDIADAKKSIDEFVNMKYKGIIWTGGEPTMYPQLDILLQYAKKKGMDSRMVTNGQLLSDFKYFKKLVDAGLNHIHLSVYSTRPKVQAFLTKKSDAYHNIIIALRNAMKLKVEVNINTVINSYNSGHLLETVKNILNEFPEIKHFVWNNLDPLMNSASINTESIPRLGSFEVELYKAMEFLRSSGRTFRVERVPLCYMAEYADCSTETRKIVKKEERAIHFLDDKRDKIRQDKWAYGKAKCCSACTYNSICAGLWEMDVYYSSKELYPLFLDVEKVKKNILK